ncbi:MAG: hypothetical protein ABJA33_02640 [Pedococcus sp.]
MPENSTSRDQPARYEIRIGGHLNTRWSIQLDGMNLTLADDGTTLIAGLVTDQAALHGLLTKLRDIGLPVLSVNRASPDAPPYVEDQPPTKPLNTTS